MAQIDERLVDYEDADECAATLVPFAGLFAGDFVCLDYRKRDIPSVVVWLHEESEEFSPVTIKVAETFKDFINMLEEYDEE